MLSIIINQSSASESDAKKLRELLQGLNGAADIAIASNGAAQSGSAQLTLSMTDGDAEISLENLASYFSPDASWPVSAAAISGTLAEALMREDSSIASVAELIVQAIISAAVQGEEIARADSTASTGFRLEPAAATRRLNKLVNSANIEELFPQHDWSRHEEESAATCYHTLAAMFIRLGDSDSAAECLRLSDRLEDSPRSLALKGIIALNRGEILGAVANMVSSLQQYEARKKESEKHYQRFIPQNLEIINQKLQDGLAALNVRNNEAALECFAEAVFNFDSFYKDIGVNFGKSGSMQ